MKILERVLSLAMGSLVSGDEVERYFVGRGFDVLKRGRPGKHEADYIVVDGRGREFPVEEKR